MKHEIIRNIIFSQIQINVEKFIKIYLLLKAIWIEIIVNETKDIDQTIVHVYLFIGLHKQSYGNEISPPTLCYSKGVWTQLRTGGIPGSFDSCTKILTKKHSNQRQHLKYKCKFLDFK